MSDDKPKQGGEPFIPPVSVFAGPIAELVGHRLLSPPTRPGLMASLGGWEVLRVLGGGGMGVVVLARDAEKGRDVAIKLVKPELVSEPRVVHRFVREAGHLQKLKHPNIVPVLEVSDRPEGPYFVMPYFERGSLAAKIQPGEPLVSETIIDIALPVAEGLAFAHRHGIIHRDLKPANILLGAEGKVCLADFGLARSMFNDTLIDVERQPLEGTAPYMSPGVAAGNAEDTRCDIYSFGALMYEMLTGEPPYVGRNTEDIRRQILAGPPKPIKERNPMADSQLCAVAENAMGRELRDRYADMSDMVADLQRVKSGKKVVGPRGNSGKRSLPFSLWVPGGVVLIAAGLYLMWPPSPDKKANPILPIPPTNIAVAPAPTSAIPPVVKPPVVTPPVITPKPIPPKSGWDVSILAGQIGKSGSDDGAASSALFKSPGGIAVSILGDAYVADTGNNTIRKISHDGTVSTFAGVAGKAGHIDGAPDAARFLAPLGIAVDVTGNVYVAEFASDTIRKITRDGVVSTFAGTFGVAGSANGVGDNAHFRNPWAVAVGNGGGIYVVDNDNFTIRLITPGGLVSTFAGAAGVAGYVDGQGSYARFAAPHSIAIDPSGTIYVADTGNNVVRVISPSGLVSSFTGKLGEAQKKSKPAAMRFANVQGVAADGAANLYVLDGDNILVATANRPISQLPAAALTDANGHVVRASNMTVDSAGNLYLVEDSNNVIWKIHALPPSTASAATARANRE